MCCKITTELINGHVPRELKCIQWTPEAINAMQIAAETYVRSLIKEAIHIGPANAQRMGDERPCLEGTAQDIQLARRMRKVHNQCMLYG